MASPEGYIHVLHTRLRASIGEQGARIQQTVETGAPAGLDALVAFRLTRIGERIVNFVDHMPPVNVPEPRSMTDLMFDD